MAMGETGFDERLSAAADEFNRAREAHQQNLRGAVAASGRNEEDTSIDGLLDLLRSLWDEIADPITGQIIDWIGDLVGRISELAEIGADALLNALWEELGGDIKDWIIEEKLGPVWTGISEEAQRDFEGALGVQEQPS